MTLINGMKKRILASLMFVKSVVSIVVLPSVRLLDTVELEISSSCSLQYILLQLGHTKDQKVISDYHIFFSNICDFIYLLNALLSITYTGNEIFFNISLKNDLPRLLW